MIQLLCRIVVLWIINVRIINVRIITVIKTMFKCFMVCLCMLIIETASAEDIPSLPMDLSPGMPLRESCYLDENTYVDPTIEMHVSSGTENGSDWWMADVIIGHSSQLRVMPASKYTNSTRAPGARLSRRANAVLAINGDSFCIDVPQKGSYVLRMGKLYSQYLIGRSDVLLIDETGNFHIIHKPKEGEVPEQIEGHKVLHALCFGPALVEDGQVMHIEPDDFISTEKKVARIAICQIDMLHYAVVCCSCPCAASDGMTLQDFADFLGRKGIRWAYNLDGGNSTMMFTGKRMLNFNNTTRDISDIIYFASAWTGDQ